MLERVIIQYRFFVTGVIVTCKERLIKIFGKDDFYNEIRPRLISLAHQQRALILDVCSDDFKEVDKKIKELGNRLSIFWNTRIRTLESIAIRPFPYKIAINHIQIIGDHDIIPFAELPNPAYDGDTLYTDDVYADFTGDELIDIPIARIPDGKSLDLLIKQLDGEQRSNNGVFGLGNVNREYVAEIMDIFDDENDVYWCAPMTSDDFHVDDVNVKLVYIMLHGDRVDTSAFWGENGYPLPIGFKTNIASSKGIVFTGCCYGAYIINKTPADSICLRFLRMGAKAYIGCTGKHYSTPGTETNYNGPLFHKLFFEHLMAGNTPSKAFFNTKRDYAPDADTAVEEKILHEFVFYGRL